MTRPRTSGHSRTAVWIAAPLAVLALAGATIAVAARTQTPPVLLDSNHITICHATGNGEWVQISPDDRWPRGAGTPGAWHQEESAPDAS